MFPKLGCVQSSEQLTKNEDSWAPIQKFGFSRATWESVFLTSGSSSCWSPAMDQTSCLETAGFKDDYIYLSAILKWYHHMGQFVCQKNKIEINGEMDFLPDFELLSFWKHTATSEECLKRAGSCSRGTCSACDTTDPMSLKAGWESRWKGHIYLSVQKRHKSQQLQLS